MLIAKESNSREEYRKSFAETHDKIKKIESNLGELMGRYVPDEKGTGQYLTFDNNNQADTCKAYVEKAVDIQDVGKILVNNAKDLEINMKHIARDIESLKKMENNLQEYIKRNKLSNIVEEFEKTLTLKMPADLKFSAARTFDEEFSIDNQDDVNKFVDSLQLDKKNAKLKPWNIRRNRVISSFIEEIETKKASIDNYKERIRTQEESAGYGLKSVEERVKKIKENQDQADDSLLKNLDKTVNLSELLKEAKELLESIQ